MSHARHRSCRRSSLASGAFWLGLFLLGCWGALAACDRHAAPPPAPTLLVTLELSSTGPRVLEQRTVDTTALAVADRWGNLYFEARDGQGRLLVARDVDAPRGQPARFVLALPLRDGQPTELELFALDLASSTPTKRSLGLVRIHGEALARR